MHTLFPNPLNSPRDLVGYGRTPPDANWPGQARIAVQIVINYEEGEKTARRFDIARHWYTVHAPAPAAAPANGANGD